MEENNFPQKYKSQMIKPTKSLKSFHQHRSQLNISHHVDLQSMITDLDEIDAKLNNMTLGRKNSNEQKTSLRLQKGKTIYSSSIFNKNSIRTPPQQSESNCSFVLHKPQLQTLTSQSKNPVCFTPRLKTQITALNFRNAQRSNNHGILLQKEALNFKKAVFKANINEKVTDKQSEKKKVLANSWKKKISIHDKQNTGPLEERLNIEINERQANSKAHKMANELHREFLANYKKDEKKYRAIEKLFKELYQIAQ